MAYVEVAGRPIWHEVTGAGSPAVLLHGAFGGADSFREHVPALVATEHRVHVPERPGHAHSLDEDRPFTYQRMAEHTIAYLDEVVGDRADLVGWSDGAVVAVLVAIERPDLVGRMVLVGQYYNSSGKVTGTDLDDLLAAPETFAMMRDEYAAVSPDGAGHFQAVYDKTMHLFATEPEIDLSRLAAVTAPTLVLQGDRDEVTIEHSRAVVEALPDARLAVLPGTHLLPLELPAVVNPLLVWWLRRPGRGTPAS